MESQVIGKSLREKMSVISSYFCNWFIEKRYVRKFYKFYVVLICSYIYFDFYKNNYFYRNAVRGLTACTVVTVVVVETSLVVDKDNLIGLSSSVLISSVACDSSFSRPLTNSRSFPFAIISSIATVSRSLSSFRALLNFSFST